MSKIGGILKTIGIVAEVLPKVVGIFSKSKNEDPNSRAGETFAEDVAGDVAGEETKKQTKSRKSVKKMRFESSGNHNPSRK